MNQQSVNARDIQAAGGLEKWMRKAAGRGPQATERPLRDIARECADRNKPRPAAKGRRPADATLGYVVDRMNKLEARYAGRLEAMKRAGQIVFWKFEAVALRLADKTTYNPDFYLMLPDGSVGFHETKGFWRDDARAKIKVAAEEFPELFFVAVQWDSKAKEWRFERFGRGRQ